MRRKSWHGWAAIGTTVLVLALVGGGCGDDDGGCADECSMANTAQCGGTFIQICSPGADGCLGWVDSVDCADSLQICDDSTGNVFCASDCTDQCPIDGDTQCTGTLIETCLELPNGCLDWQETSDCADLGLLCEDFTGDASCMDECVDECTTVTNNQCNGTVIETCATGPDGCLDWEGGTDCADTSELCDDSTGDAACSLNCAITGPAVPTGAAPAHQATMVDETTVTRVDWTDSNGVTSYDVYFGDTCPPPAYPDAAFQNVTVSELTGLTLLTDTAYCWQVVAIDSSCAVEGPVWNFHTTCVDPVAGPPTVTSTLATLYAIGTTADSYTLSFSEDVSGVITGLTWIPVTGSGTLGTVTQVDPQTYTVPFSGAADGDQYTLTVTTAVQDVCGNPVTTAVNIAISVDAVSAGTWDNCTDAGTLQLGVPSSPPTLPTGDVLNDGSGSCWTEQGADIIASYTATSTDPLLFTWTGVSLASGIYRNYEIWRNSCDPTVGVEEFCDNITADNDSVKIISVAVGDVFYMKAIAEDTGDDFTAATFEVSIAPPPPTGALCADPIDLDTTGVPHQELGAFETNNATGGSCDTVADQVVWYNYTPPVTGWYTIDATNAETASVPYSRIAIFETTACTTYGPEVACQTEFSNTISVTNVQLDAGITYTIVFYTDGAQYFMVDPTINIGAGTAPPPGETCTLPAAVGASNHSVDGNNHDCWSWSVDSTNTINDHVFTCDSVVGGDVVIEFTTSASATTMAFDATINNWQIDGYIGIEITDGPCATGASLYCFSPGTTGTFSDAGTVSVQPNTTYYVWLSDGYSGHYLPDVNACLWDY